MSVDDDYKLMIAAAYGDLNAIPPDTTSLEGRFDDISAAMVAAANGQKAMQALLEQRFPTLTTNKTKYRWDWRKATHNQYKGQVYLPVTHSSTTQTLLTLFIFVVCKRTL